MSLPKKTVLVKGLAKQAKKVKPVIGWREWIALPELHIPEIKVKVDTGARSSSLHAFDLELTTHQGRDYIHFKVHPLQRNHTAITSCVARLHDIRSVRSSNGKSQRRPVIRTHVAIGGEHWDIDLTLTPRDEMGFRMLLGREAIRGRFLIDAGRSFLLKKLGK